MTFKKLALAAAVAALPATGFSMEAMEDSALSGVTGQDGLTIGLNLPNLTLDVNVHDNDGLAGISGDAGAIMIDDMVINTGGNSIDVVVDADGNGGAPVLNVGVTIPTGTTISTGDISVGSSAGMGNAMTAQSSVILDSMDITLGATTMNIQLGNEVQTVGGLAGTQMIALNSVITGGINITNFSLNDATATTGGSLSATNIAVTGTAEGGDITTAIGVNLDNTDGLVIGIDTLGTAGLTVEMTDVALGTATPIGDVEIVGLNLNGSSITVAGH